jgi:hypothetical protein
MHCWTHLPTICQMLVQLTLPRFHSFGMIVQPGKIKFWPGFNSWKIAADTSVIRLKDWQLYDFFPPWSRGFFSSISFHLFSLNSAPAPWQHYALSSVCDFSIRLVTSFISLLCAVQSRSISAELHTIRPSYFQSLHRICISENISHSCSQVWLNMLVELISICLVCAEFLSTS